jgi:hypothetical protein
MTQGKLTPAKDVAKPVHMQGAMQSEPVGKLAAALLASLAIAGCVTVNAPSEPIVIELNVNIRQEVIYRLAEDAGNTIEENADIF